MTVTFFDRKTNLTIGQNTINVDYEFSIVKDADPKTPSTLDLSIYNLSDKNRTTLEDAGSGALVNLVAGYGQEVFNIFLGGISSISSRVQGPDVITSVQAVEGLNFQRVRWNKTWRGGTAWKQVLDDIMDHFISQINALSTKENEYRGSDTVKNAIGTSGLLWPTFVDICAGLGVYPTIEGDTILVVPTSLSKDKVVDLNPDSGLIGSAEIDIVEETTGKRTKKVEYLIADALLQPGLEINRTVSVSSNLVEATGVIKRATIVGGTRSPEQFVTIEARI